TGVRLQQVQEEVREVREAKVEQIQQEEGKETGSSCSSSESGESGEAEVPDVEVPKRVVQDGEPEAELRKRVGVKCAGEDGGAVQAVAVEV
ncbi:hypothetical protein HK097_009773, partial [Rhizophlyctis rosea]